MYRFAERLFITCFFSFTIGFLIFAGTVFYRTKSKESIIIGCKADIESQIIGEIIASYLEEKMGKKVERRFGLDGFFAFHALLSGDIDLYPEYTGTAMECLLHLPQTGFAQSDLKEISHHMQKRHRLVVGPPLGVDCQYCFLMKKERAKEEDLSTLSDLAKAINTKRIVMGMYPEYHARSEYRKWKSVYEITSDYTPLHIDQDLGFVALDQRGIDVAIGQSTNSKIDTLDLISLEDDRNALPHYFAFPLIHRKALAKERNLLKYLLDLENCLKSEDIFELHRLVERRSGDFQKIVHHFLISKNFISSAPP